MTNNNIFTTIGLIGISFGLLLLSVLVGVKMSASNAKMLGSAGGLLLLVGLVITSIGIFMGPSNSDENEGFCGQCAMSRPGSF